VLSQFFFVVIVETVVKLISISDLYQIQTGRSLQMGVSALPLSPHHNLPATRLQFD
jgi:hypothetical protein